MVRTSFRRAIALAIVLGALTLGPAGADEPAEAPPDTPPAADLDRLVTTLQDDARRQALIDQLKTLAAAQHAIEAQHPVTPVTLLDQARDRLQVMGSDMVEAATVLVDLPSVARWVEAQIGTPATRARWIDVGRNLAMILGTAILADWCLALALTFPRRKLRQRPARSWSGRIGLTAADLVLDALPALAFTLTAFGVMPLVQPRFATESVVTDLVTIMLIGRLLLVVARSVLLSPRRRFPFLSEETASYLYIWARRFVFWAIYAFGVIGATWWLGVPGAVLATLQKVVALVVTLLGIVFVLQNRHPIGDWIRPRPSGAETGPPPEDAGEIPIEPVPGAARRHPAVDLLRLRLAEIWHVLAVVYLVGIFCVYALRIEGGFAFLFRATVLTIALISAARLLVQGVARLAAHGFAVPADMKTRFPTLELRANRYLPILTGLASAVVWSFALLAILQVWGIGSFAWLGSELGRKTAGSAISVGTILAFGFGVWEVMNATIDRYLSRLDSAADRMGRSARMRTLLPLLRNALWFSVVVVTLLLVLTALDINIVPLLAGASVIGLAVGIGSQALVKDVITGLFILIEDTMAVGDVVDLGAPHSGVVEAISIRSVRLRDQLGAVHTLPFSEISKVKNLGKDYAYWLIDLALPPSTDPDRVLAVCAEVLASLRHDAGFGSLIIGDLDPIGINGFNATTIQVQARIKTLPLQQWKVGREFNRRLKTALEAARIPLYSSAQMIGLDGPTSRLIERLAIKSP